ncbi:MAG: GtrA family protein, partial [Conexibacter sp.]|nr:GtrA family protein [Conexibacter sp.]
PEPVAGRWSARRAHDALPPTVQRLLRFVLAGGLTATVNFGSSAALLLLGLPVQAAVALAYLITVTTHFTLQRLFVFAGQGEFALPLSAQLRRYAAVALVQYPATAGLVAGFVALGAADIVAVVCAAILVMPITFVVLRTHLFHAVAGDEPDADAPAAPPLG